MIFYKQVVWPHTKYLLGFLLLFDEYIRYTEGCPLTFGTPSFLLTILP